MFFQQESEELTRLGITLTAVQTGLVNLAVAVEDLRDRVAALESTEPPPPPPPPPPDPVTGAVFFSVEEIKQLPMEGAAWDNLVTWASKPAAAPNLSNQDDRNDVTALAKALYYARTGQRRDEVVQMLRQAKGTEYPGDTLGIARGVLPLVLAADLINFREDAEWLAWFSGLRTWANPDRGYSLVSMHEKRPNNWGTHSGAGRIAMDFFLTDKNDLLRAGTVFQGYLGATDKYAGFVYGDDLSWQYDPAHPVGVNPADVRRGDVLLDGILPDDMRRGGSFPTIGTAGISYTYEALQGIVMQAELLHRHGYPAFEWEDQAVLRAFKRIYQEAPPTGDDAWEVYIINKRYGTTYSTTSPVQPGKSMGFTDWLYGG
jgi:hypothetical protein